MLQFSLTYTIFENW